MEKTKDSYFAWLNILCFILLIKSAILVWFILKGSIGLAPDEAQYWSWSQELDWGYYSKPPGIAWQIWLGTLFFGNTELGVRSTAVAIGFLISVAVFFLARYCRLQPQTCFWAGLILALSPLGILSSFLAITDGGMILFWTATCAYLVKDLDEEKTPNYRAIGILILFGALFKWPIFILWLFILAFAWFYPKMASKDIFTGMVISSVGLVPSLVWNFSHDWVTFRHVYWTIVGNNKQEVGTTPLAEGNFWEFLGAQAILLSPIFFLLLLASFGFLIRKRKELRPSLLFCGWTSFAIVAFYCFLALFKKMQGNWCVFAYPTGIVFLAWYACEKLSWGKIALFGGIALSLLIVVSAFSIPYIQSHNLFPNSQIPYSLNSFRHNLGWHQLEKELQTVGYDPNKDFLFGDKYQMTSILSFYSPGQKRAYFLNLNSIRKNQFSFWPSMAEEQKGKDGYFVLAENTPHLEKNFPLKIKKYEEILKNYFDSVTFLGIKPLAFTYNRMTKGALIFKCVNYHGNLPTDPELY